MRKSYDSIAIIQFAKHDRDIVKLSGHKAVSSLSHYNPHNDMEKKIAMAGAMLLSKRPLEVHQPSDTGLENVENVPPESDSRQGPPQTQTEFPGFSTQRPSATVTSGAYQALTSTTDESFTEPSYVVVNNETEAVPYYWSFG